MQRSTFKVLFCLKRQSENPIRFPSWVVSPSTARCRSSATNSPFVPPSGMPRLKKLPVGVSKPSVSMKSWKTSKPISVSCINVSATVICMLRPKRFATPFWVWAMTAVFCCKPSTNTLQASSNVWAKTAPIPPMRITACGAGVLQLCTNTNTMSRTFRSKS